MEFTHILIVLLRPLVWGFIGLMITAFGSRFLKNLMNFIAIFLFAICIAGGVLISGYIEKIADPFYEATTDDWTGCIVGSVTIISFMLIGTAYLLSARRVGQEDKKENAFVRVLQTIVSWMLMFLLPFIIMGYCLPFFLLDSIAAMIVGVIGEMLGITLAIFIIINKIKK